MNKFRAMNMLRYKEKSRTMCSLSLSLIRMNSHFQNTSERNQFKAQVKGQTPRH